MVFGVTSSVPFSLSCSLADGGGCGGDIPFQEHTAWVTSSGTLSRGVTRMGAEKKDMGEVYRDSWELLPVVL